jgi:prolyl oligopeptidase
MKLTNLTVLLLIMTGCQTMKKPVAIDELAHLNYLEQVEGSEALAFAVKNNALSDDRLKNDPRYSPTFDEIFKIVSAKDKLPVFYQINHDIYNFWQDDVHIKGILRKTSIEAFNAKEIHWQTVLDIDKLAKDEGQNWVYQGMTCLEPQNELCLLSLSDGGKDAAVIREFNLKSKKFVDGGFVIPESKSSVAWVDQNTIMVGDATDPATLSPAGYPSQIKVLKRNEKLSSAPVVFKCDSACIAADVGSGISNGERYVYVGNQISFFEAEIFIVDFENNKLRKLPIPRTAAFEGIYQGHVLFSNREPYEVFAPGSLLSMKFSEIDAYKARIYPVFQPTKSSFYERSGKSKNHLYIETLNDVKKQVIRATFKGEKWDSELLSFGNKIGNAAIASVNPDTDDVYLSYSDFLTPVSVFYNNSITKQSLQPVLKSPARFNSAPFKIEQFKVASRDGTLVPYFVVSAKTLKLNSKNPTLLYAYGGFEIPMTANYLGTTGKVWLEKGGVYVLANIRGGGEYGPNWHRSALRENRQRAFDDFYAIAEDLIKRKITSPRHLGIRGGSNGGLLMGVAFTQRPELFNAVISEVPLANMLEYHKWLAGASWMEEYGNPEDPKMREFLLGYSPLHNLKKDLKYPEVFFLTSTKDDRVHPAHARQMVARMQELGLPVLYNENTDGGHGRATNMADLAEFLALEFTYLYQKLF